MKYIFTTILTLTIYYAYCQSDDQVITFRRYAEMDIEMLQEIGALNLFEIQNTYEVTELAKKDIENDHIFLLLISGDAPSLWSGDMEFEKQYNVYLYDYGLKAPKEEFVELYNGIMFDFLYSKYGTRWQNNVRDDLIGYQKWLKK